MESLFQNFVLAKNAKPLSMNELLDFLQKEYVQNRITILEYRNLFRELTERGASKPSSIWENSAC